MGKQIIKQGDEEIRRWEIVDPRQYSSITGTGNALLEIPVPDSYPFGGYIHLRDVLFLYPNAYGTLEIVLKNIIGVHKKAFSLTIPRYNSPHGPAYFMDYIIKPSYGHKYYLQIPKLPSLPLKYNLNYKLHYRSIYKDEWNRLPKEIKDYLEGRYIGEQHNEKSKEIWEYAW
ncbi:MAG TPA: hypothetical protein VN922_12405 [Bacteroidia bacterium]|nr:hypothetical protein [Bacteroidia bacterium]